MQDKIKMKSMRGTGPREKVFFKVFILFADNQPRIKVLFSIFWPSYKYLKFLSSVGFLGLTFSLVNIV